MGNISIEGIQFGNSPLCAEKFILPTCRRLWREMWPVAWEPHVEVDKIQGLQYVEDAKLSTIEKNLSTFLSANETNQAYRYFLFETFSALWLATKLWCHHVISVSGDLTYELDGVRREKGGAPSQICQRVPKYHVIDATSCDVTWLLGNALFIVCLVCLVIGSPHEQNMAISVVDR